MKRRAALWILALSALAVVQAVFAGTGDRPKTIFTLTAKWSHRTLGFMMVGDTQIDASILADCWAWQFK